MKIHDRILMILCLLAVCTSGCKKFLDENSQSLQYADNWEKLNEVLIGTGYMPHLLPTIPVNSVREQPASSYFSWLNMMDDDIAEYVTGPGTFDGRKDYFGFFTWQANPFVSNTYAVSTDDTWSKIYTNINAVSIIAAKAEQLKDNPAELQRIRGEALFLRAEFYFYLVNTYAKAYNKQTAATDPGVPLKVTEYVEDRFFGRSTVDSVYRQIVADLKTAETLLENGTQTSLYHADVNAVNILQSRVYLYMQEWQLAIDAADKVIARRPLLYNLSTYKAQTSFASAASPEAVFTQGSNGMLFTVPLYGTTKILAASADLIGKYDIKDLRLAAFYERTTGGVYRYTKVYRSSSVTLSEVFSDNFFLHTSEAYLNKAEAAAMLDKTGDANTALNTLRSARFLPADYTPVNLSGAALIDFVRDERRRELSFEGHRWFDLKRYAVNEKYPFTKTIVHTWSDAATFGAPVLLKATLTLVPGDAAYLVPIPPAAIQFNQGVLVGNPPRQDRTF